MPAPLTHGALPDHVAAGVLAEPNDQRRKGDRPRVQAMAVAAVKHHPAEVGADLTKGCDVGHGGMVAPFAREH